MKLMNGLSGTKLSYFDGTPRDLRQRSSRLKFIAGRSFVAFLLIYGVSLFWYMPPTPTLKTSQLPEPSPQYHGGLKTSGTIVPPTHPIVELQSIRLAKSFENILAGVHDERRLAKLGDALFQRWIHIFEVHGGYTGVRGIRHMNKRDGNYEGMDEEEEDEVDEHTADDQGDNEDDSNEETSYNPYSGLDDEEEQIRFFKPERVECPALDLARYNSSSLLVPRADRGTNDEPLSIAINLHDSVNILPALSEALLQLAYYLRPSRRIYISIFENGSHDPTCQMLGHLASALLALGVDGIFFRCSVLERPEDTPRIPALAILRNEALYPLMPYAQNGTLLFINDVVTCGFDLIELVHQLHLQNAHVAMGTDWGIPDNPEATTSTAEFYDKWVARGINGALAYPFREESGPTWSTLDSKNWVQSLWSTQEESIYQRWLGGRPLPVYSGWNGAIAVRAELFTAYRVRFRASGRQIRRAGSSLGYQGPWGELLATPGYLKSDCSSSECKLFARDVWNALEGKARFVLAPQTTTFYTVQDYNRMINQRDNLEGNPTIPPVVRMGAEDLVDELIDWSQVKAPETVVCVNMLNGDGNEEDPWRDDNTREYLKPLFEPYLNRNKHLASEKT